MATTLFQGVRVFDGESVLERHDVLVVDSLIQQVGVAIDADASAETIDGTGMTLLPGLIDAHTHTKPPVLEMALTFGVTTELDMFSDPSWMTAYREEAQIRNDIADVRSAMIGASVRGGHTDKFIGPFFDREFPVVESPEAAEAFVLARVEEGADYLKIMVDDGTLTGLTGTPTLSEKTIEALVATAKRHGLLVVAHAGTVRETLLAVNAGVDGLAHLYSDQKARPDEVRQIVDSGVFIVATLSTMQSIHGDLEAAHLAEDERARPYLSDAWRGNLHESWHLSEPGSTEIAKENAYELFKAGVDILAGTDACVPGVPGSAHGVSMHGELELLVASGLSPVAALRAATSLTATRFGLTDRGRIAPGKQADLLLVEGDPTTNITDSLSISGVWRRGARAHRQVAVAG